VNEKKASAPEGLGEDPLGDDPLLETLYETEPASPRSLRRRGRPTGGGRRPLADGQTYRLVTFSFYEEDVERLDALLAEAKARGHRKASRSQIVRLALRQVNLDELPDPI
jgi:hypothetical protein